jgi:hypothetical protein
MHQLPAKVLISLLLLTISLNGQAQTGFGGLFKGALEKITDTSAEDQKRAAELLIQKANQQNAPVTYSEEAAKAYKTEETERNDIARKNHLAKSNEIKRIRESLDSTFQRQLQTMLECRDIYQLVVLDKEYDLDDATRDKASSCSDEVDNRIMSNKNLIATKSEEFNKLRSDNDLIVGFDGFVLGDTLIIAALTGNPSPNRDKTLNTYPVVQIRPAPFDELFDLVSHDTEVTTSAETRAIVSVTSVFRVRDRGICLDGSTKGIIENLSNKYEFNIELNQNHEFRYLFSDAQDRTIQVRCEIPGSWFGPEGITLKELTIVTSDNSALERMKNKAIKNNSRDIEKASSADIF